jgi:hypothetical protein
LTSAGWDFFWNTFVYGFESRFLAFDPSLLVKALAKAKGKAHSSGKPRRKRQVSTSSESELSVTSPIATGDDQPITLKERKFEEIRSFSEISIY